MASFFDRLKKQIDPFDGGATFSNPKPKAAPARTPAPGQKFSLTNNSLTRGVSRSIDQANPFDNGRTWKQRTPTSSVSGIYQATHNGLTNLAGDIAKQPVHLSMAINQAAGNLGTMAAGGKSQNAQQFYGKKVTGFTGYTGTKRQIAGDTIGTVATVAMPGSSKILNTGISKAVSRVTPQIVQRATPTIVKRTAPQIVGNAIVGGAGGAINNVGTYIASEQPLTRQGFQKSASDGLKTGAALGATLPIAGVAAKGVIRSAQKTAPVVRETATKVKNATSLETPDTLALKQQNTLLQKQFERTQDLRVRDAAAKQIAINTQEINKIKQGGYVRVPGKDTSYRSAHQITDATPIHKVDLNTLKEQVRQLDGYISNSASSDFRKLQKIASNPEADVKIYRASPKNEINSGDWVTTSKTYANDIKRQNGGKVYEYTVKAKDLNLPADITNNPSLARFSAFQYNQATKNKLGFTKLNQGGYVKLPGKDPMQSVFDQNPVNEKATAIQAKRIAEQSVKNDKINTDFAQNGAQLPEFTTKMVPKRDKVFRSTRSVIERQGEQGKQLAGMLQGQRDTKELFIRDLEKRLPTVRSLKPKEFENFVDATQGQVTPMNERVVKAIQEWQTTHPGIRERAVATGLDVGDLGATYYPHFIDFKKVFGDKNTYNAAINHLVKTGQAPNAEEAISLLSYARDVSRNRQFGNLEASRLIDIPFYDKSKNSLASYLNGSADRITKAETFGAKDENALKLIADAGKQGFDTEAMKNAYDVAVGAKKYNPNTSAASGAIRKYVTTTRLGLGALTNVSQNVNTGVVTGHMNTLMAMGKQFSQKQRTYAADTGVISDAVINDLKEGTGYSNFTSKVLGTVVNKITAPGFGAVEKFNRRVAAVAGRDYALRLAQKGDEATLRKLGVTGKIEGKTLTEAQQIQASRKVVEKTQFKVDAQDLPGWVDSPGGKLVAQFRTFSYNQGKFFSNEVLKPMAKGNIMPLTRVMAALPLGYGLYEIKRMIAGRPEEENPKKIAQAAFQNVGGAGLPFDIYNSLNPVGSKYIPSDRRVSMSVGTLGGPAAGVASQGMGALSDVIQRKNVPKDPSTLEGKFALANTGNTYTDATAAARFGMQQIPIVGTAIMNRTLPYKKQSQAETGKLPLEGKASAATVKELTTADRITQSFTTPKGKEMLAVKSDDREAWARQSPENMQLYKELKRMQDRFSPTVKDSINYSVDELAFKKKEASLQDSGRATWYKKFDASAQSFYDEANKQLPADFAQLPQNNEVVSQYIAYKQKQATAKSNLEKSDNLKEFIRKGYQTSLSDNAKVFFSGSDYNADQKIAAIKSGEITQKDLEEAIIVDNYLVAKGLSSKPAVTKAVRSYFGYGTPSTSSGGSSRMSGGKKSRKLSLSDFSMADIYKINSSNQKRLRELLALTTLK